MHNIIDTFPSFLTFWEEVGEQPINRQIHQWAAEYLAPWPELLAKQVDDYASQNVDWQQIAREKVFPYLAERLVPMRQAHANLLQMCEPIYSKAEKVLEFESDATFVIYVGIGCGAGWVTSYHGLPAILFGIENIAECGWEDRDSIAGLIAHETGHLAHEHWRAQHGKLADSGPWWQLYIEGFAQRCEELILGQPNWHMETDPATQEWLAWCQDNKNWLALEFLRQASTGGTAQAFFGSWYGIEGHSECGYFLGHELIKTLEANYSLKEIAVLEDVNARLSKMLKDIAEQTTVNSV